MKQKKIIIILGIAVAVLCFFVIVLFALLLAADTEVSSDEIEDYNYMSENYAHFTGSIIEKVPIEELNILVPGVDYEPKNIAAAFDKFYSADDDGSDMSGGITHVVRNEQNAGLVARRKTVARGPDAWVGLGDTITRYIDKQDAGQISEDLYEALSKPQIWVRTGDAVVEYIDSKIAENGELPDPDDVIAVITEGISVFVEDENIAEEMSTLDEIITDFVEEQFGDIETEVWEEYTESFFDNTWNDYRDKPVPENIPQEYTPKDEDYGYIMAEDYPINYKTYGRQFYRETLDKAQQLAYDIVASSVQAGVFEVECFFGLDEDAMKTVLMALKMDFPEFFFLSGYAPVDIHVSGSVRCVAAGIDTSVEAIGIDTALKRVAAKADPVIAEAKKLEMQIDQVKFVVDHICSTTVYPKLDEQLKTPSGKSVFDLQTLWSCVIESETVCAGYADTFHYYMNRLGIPAAELVSKDHAWNLIQLDGDYYYMDVTWVDSGSNYHWFNFNEDLLSFQSKAENYIPGAHVRTKQSASLPAANGTKYYYENWFGSLEPPPQTLRAQWVPAAVSASVIINGYDVSSSLNVVKEGDVLYARGKAFVEAFADPGANGSPRWFNYKFDADTDEIYISDSADRSRLLTLIPYANYAIRYEDNKDAGHPDMSANVQKYEGEVYIPMLVFAKVLSETGSESEIIIDGKVYSFSPFVSNSEGAPDDPADSVALDNSTDMTVPGDPTDSETPDDSWSDPGHSETGNSGNSDSSGKDEPSGGSSSGSQKRWNIPEGWESAGLLDDWSKGPVSLGVEMEDTEVIENLAGTYVGYRRYSNVPFVFVFNQDNATGTCDEDDPEYPPCHFEFVILFDVQHPMFENMYNGLITGECTEAGHEENYEFVVVSPTVLYEPMYEAILYKVK